MKRFKRRFFICLSLVVFSSLLSSCFLFEDNSTKSDGTPKGKLVMFVGVDISGSFLRSKSFKDSLEFLSNYIYAHLNGIGDLDVPHSLFIGSIGGRKTDEAKTFFPIQAFQYLSIPEIHKKLKSIFPKNKTNPFTDYNSFFKQVAEFVESKSLTLRPISILMLSDGIPDSPKKYDYKSIKLEPLEFLARNITLRVLYTSADVGKNWRTKITRQRVKIWTQDANVMKDWKSKQIFQPELPFKEKKRFFSWIKDNVDFKVRIRRVK